LFFGNTKKQGNPTEYGRITFIHFPGFIAINRKEKTTKRDMCMLMLLNTPNQGTLEMRYDAVYSQHHITRVCRKADTKR